MARREAIRGTGMFTGNPGLPQDLSRPRRAWSGTLRGGATAAGRPSYESSVYSGAAAGPQRFVRQEGGTNSRSALSGRLPVNQRRTIGGFRGTADMATGNGE